MRTYNMHEAKTHLSRLVNQAANGEPFIIARSGKPIVKVMPLDAATAGAAQRVGFLDGKIRVPEDFNQMGANEVERLFGDNE